MIASAKFQHLLQEAVAHHQGGRLARADAIYRQLSCLAPRNALVQDLMGQLALQQGRHIEGMRHLLNACQFDERAVSSAIRLAGALIDQNHIPEAERILRHMVAKNPQSHEAWNALGFTLKVAGRVEDAVVCHERAVTRKPNYIEGWYHLGLTLGSCGRNERALECHERALALDPKFHAARHGRAQSLHKTYRLREAVAEYEAFLRAEPGNLDARSYRLFALQSLEGMTREQLFAEHRAYGKMVGPDPKTVSGYNLEPDRRLRLAILSPDLRTHSCAYFLEPLLRHLNASEFEVYLYHDHFVEDDVSARLKTYATVWRNFIAQANGVIESTIRADQPDILVDLSGHIGSTMRLPLFAKRLAPVQITYLGYPDTTGVPAMDYRFTDAIADPLGDADRFATEKLIRFAPTAWTYQPPADAPAPCPPPSTQGGPVTFGCFSSPTKFTDSLFVSWARLLAEVPESRLLLKGSGFESETVAENVVRRMRAQGVPLERVELLPWTGGTAAHLALYSKIDVALDTFPYVGTTTTCEALWMGRPVVTLCGDRHAARVGASLLTAIGRPEWIARDAEDYVRIAATLARNPSALSQLASDLRTELQRSPLLEHAAQGARFSSALRGCWRERVAALSTS